MRSTVQPFRRNSALQRRTDDLILYLKFEDNFDDSSYYDQKTLDHNPEVVSTSDAVIRKPVFNKNNFFNEIGWLAGKSTQSVYFRGAHEEPPGPPFQAIKGDAFLVSGTGVYSNGPDTDSAAEFDLNEDFTFECWAKFDAIPEGSDDDPGATIFDFGNLKLTNTSGFFTMHGPDGGITDFYEKENITANSAQNITKNFFHYAVQRRDNQLEFWMDYKDPSNPKNNVFKVCAVDEYCPGIVSGIRDDPYRSVRSIGSTITGTNFFTGYIDNFKVWKEAIYGPGMVVGNGPEAKGIFVQANTMSSFPAWRGSFGRYTFPWVAPFTMAPSRWSRWYSNQGYRSQTVYYRTGQSLWMWCTCRSYYDPRYSLHRMLPWSIEWKKLETRFGLQGSSSGYRSLGTSNWRRNVFIAPNIYLNRNGMNGLTLLNMTPADEGTYAAIVRIGAPNRPSYYFGTPPLTSVFLRWYQPPPPPPPPKAPFSMHCAPHSLNLGDTVILKASYYHYSFHCWNPADVCPSGPITYKWKNKGRGSQDNTPIVWWNPSWWSADYYCPGWGMKWPTTQLTFKNIRKSIKGPICVEATDGAGNKSGEICCPGISIRLPDIECPKNAATMLPDKSNKNWTVSPGYNVRRWQYDRLRGWYLLSYATAVTCTAVYSTLQANLNCEVILTDPNPPELQTGGLKYEWSANVVRYVGNDKTTDSSYNHGFIAGTNKKTYNLFEDSSGTITCRVTYANYDPRVHGYYVKDPEGRWQRTCEMYYTWTVNVPECYEPKIETAAAWFLRRFSDLGQLQTAVGAQSTNQLGGGKESDQSVVEIEASPCQKITVPIHFIKKTGGRDSKTLAQYRVGLTNEVVVGGTTSFDSSLEVLSPYVNASQAWYHYYYKDLLLYSKTLYADDDGKEIVLTFKNECGESKVTYLIKIIKGKPALRSYSYSGGGIGSSLPFFEQTIRTFNWWQRPRVYSNRLDRWPAMHWGYLQATGLGACFAWRAFINGRLVKNWTEDTNWSNAGLRLGVHTSWWYGRWWWGYYYNINTPWNFNWYVTPDRSVWPKKSNTFKIEVSTNLPGPGKWDQGTKASFTYNVTFKTFPTITSPGWGWGGYWWNWRYYYRGYYRISMYRQRYYVPYWWYRNFYGWQRSYLFFRRPTFTQTTYGRGFSTRNNNINNSQR
jgi:hypothetical protein